MRTVPFDPDVQALLEFFDRLSNQELIWAIKLGYYFIANEDDKWCGK